MSELDPQTVLTAREIAHKHLTIDSMTVTPADIVDAVKAYFGDGLNVDTLQSWCLALRAELVRATITATVSWPDEQPQDMCSCNEPRAVCELRTELDKREIRIAALEAENARMREEQEAFARRLRHAYRTGWEERGQVVARVLREGSGSAAELRAEFYVKEWHTSLTSGVEMVAGLMQQPARDTADGGADRG